MADAAVTEPVVTPPPTQWWSGLDDVHKGHVQSKGWDKLDPAAAAVAAAQAHREAQQYVGAPASELLRIPKQEDAAGQVAFWEKLGAQKDKAGYKLDDVKYADGTPLKPALVDSLTAAAAELHMPVEMFTRFATKVVQYQEGEQKAELASRQVAIQAEREKLATNWGAQADVNKFVAGRAVAALNIPPEAVTALENAAGYAATMEMFRDLGVRLGEAKFVTGASGGDNVMSREQAIARRAELTADRSWGARWINDGPNSPERKELWALDVIINKVQTNR